MPVVRAVQVTADDIIDMIAVRNAFMPAARSVRVAALVAATAMLRCALGRVRAAHCDRVIVYVIAMNVVHMTVMQIICMSVVLNRLVSASLAVAVTMLGMNVA